MFSKSFTRRVTLRCKMEDVPMLQGYLLKEKSKSGMLHGLTGDINKRYFRVQRIETSHELALCYYKNAADPEVRGWIYLRDMTEIAEDQDTVILTSVVRTLHLYAPTRAEHNMWVTGLAKLCPEAFIKLGRNAQLLKGVQGADSKKNNPALSLAPKAKLWTSKGGSDLPSLNEGGNDLTNSVHAIDSGSQPLDDCVDDGKESIEPEVAHSIDNDGILKVMNQDRGQGKPQNINDVFGKRSTRDKGSSSRGSGRQRQVEERRASWGLPQNDPHNELEGKNQRSGGHFTGTSRIRRTNDGCYRRRSSHNDTRSQSSGVSFIRREVDDKERTRHKNGGRYRKRGGRDTSSEEGVRQQEGAKDITINHTPGGGNIVERVNRHNERSAAEHCYKSSNRKNKMDLSDDGKKGSLKPSTKGGDMEENGLEMSTNCGGGGRRALDRKNDQEEHDQEELEGRSNSAKNNEGECGGAEKNDGEKICERLKGVKKKKDHVDPSPVGLSTYDVEQSGCGKDNGRKTFQSDTHDEMATNHSGIYSSDVENVEVIELDKHEGYSHVQNRSSRNDLRAVREGHEETGDPVPLDEKKCSNQDEEVDFYMHVDGELPVPPLEILPWEGPRLGKSATSRLHCHISGTNTEAIGFDDPLPPPREFLTNHAINSPAGTHCEENENKTNGQPQESRGNARSDSVTKTAGSGRRRSAADLEWSDGGVRRNLPRRLEDKLTPIANSGAVGLGDSEGDGEGDLDLEVEKQRRRANAAILALEAAAKEADKGAQVERETVNKCKNGKNNAEGTTGKVFRKGNLPSPAGHPLTGGLRKGRRGHGVPPPGVAPPKLGPSMRMKSASQRTDSDDNFVNDDWDDDMKPVDHDSTMTRGKSFGGLPAAVDTPRLAGVGVGQSQTNHWMNFDD